MLADGARCRDMDDDGGGADDAEQRAPRGLDLHGKDLRKVDLAALDLVDADLRRAKLAGVDLTGRDLSGARLTGADLSGCRTPHGALWRQAEADATTRWPGQFDPTIAGIRFAR